MISSGQFITSSEIADLGGYSKSNPSAAPSRWKKERRIFSITPKGIDYFPLFALDPDNDYRPYEAVGEILGIFGDSLSGWGISSWFIGLNGFLDDQSPKDLLASDPEWTIEAAKPPEMRSAK